MGKGATTTTNSVHLGQQGSFEAQMFGTQGNTAQIDSAIRRLREARENVPGSMRKELDKQISALQKQRTTGSQGLLQQEFGNLQNMINAGPGQQDIEAGVGASRDLASMLADLTRTGGIPGQEDISQANKFASDIFGARKLQMQQMFQDQMQQSNAQLAVSGRDINDPVMRAKLLQEQGRQQSLLGAEQQGFAAQFAQQLPMQRLGFAGQRADVLNALGDRAQQNRLALLGIGSSLGEAERAWRLNTATRKSTQEKEVGLGDVVTGAIGLGGTVLGFANLLGGGASALSGMGGGGGGGGGGMANTIPLQGGMNQGPMMANGNFTGYGGQQSIFSAFPNFPGAGVGTGQLPAYGQMGERRAY